MKNEKIKTKLKGLIKNKYALIVLVVGLLILILPTGGGSKAETKTETDLAAPDFSLQTEENRLQKQLSKIQGAGRVSVLLSVEGSVSRELAESGEETLVISENGGERVVELYYVNPIYKGAVIVCDGAAASAVKLEITKAVSAFTGLGSDKIRVIQMA